MQHDRPAADHLPAHRRRRARALPRPALLAHRVQRPLARVARRLAWTSAGSPASARTPTGGSATGTTPARRRPAAAWRSCSRLNEKWPYPLHAERVRAAPVPRAVPGRPRRRRLPAHHRAVDDRVGQRLPARRRARSAAARSCSTKQFAGVPDDERAAMLGGTLGGLLGLRGPGAAPERAPLRRARRGRHRRGTRHRPRLRAPARRTGRDVVVNDLGGSMEGDGADAEPASARRRPRSSPPAARRSPTPATSPRPPARQALVDAAVERFGRLDILINNAGIIRWAGFPEADADNLERAPRRARRRLVQHHPRRVAAHGRAGLRPHRHDDVGRAVRAAQQPLLRHGEGRRHRARRAASRPRAPRTASRSTLIAPAACTRMAGAATRAGAEPQMAPELVAPMVAFLAHEDCPVSGEIYAAGAGRFARIFIASTAGYVHADAGADDRGRRRALGRRSTTRPATTCPPTSSPGRRRSWRTCASRYRASD